MDTLLMAISKCKNGTELIVEWENGYKIFGYIDTIYETDNELELDDKDYKEYYAALIYITDIINNQNVSQIFNKGDFMELSIQNPPIKVFLKNGTIIWEN